MNKLFIPIKRIDEEKKEVYGYAQTEALATDGLVLENKAMEKASDRYFEKGPALRAMHMTAAGSVLQAEVRDDGTYIAARVVDPNEWLKVKEGVYRGFSVSGNIKELDGNRITEFDWIETSLVDRMADPGATIELWRSEQRAPIDFGIYRGSTAFADLPTNSNTDRAWDATAARKRIAKWAGGPDKKDVDWKKYQKAFFWFDADDPENFESYKLPFADIGDGSLRAEWGGVSNSMKALLGARGGVDIPEKDRKSVFNHISKYYKKFDKEIPEFRAEHAEPDKKSGKGGKEMSEDKNKIVDPKVDPDGKNKIIPGKSGDIPPDGGAIVHEVNERLESVDKTLARLAEILDKKEEPNVTDPKVDPDDKNKDAGDVLVKRLEAMETKLTEAETAKTALTERLEKIENQEIPPKVKTTFAIERAVQDRKEKNKEKAEPIVRRLKELERLKENDLRRYEKEGRTKEALGLFSQLRQLGFRVDEVME